MDQDIEGMLTWIKVCVVLAAIFSTSFPVLYGFSRWYEAWLGRALMVQAVAFAIAIDLTAFYLFWPPTSYVVTVWVNLVVFSMIAASTGFLTWKLFEHNHLNPYLEQRNKDVKLPSGARGSDEDAPAS